MSGCPTGVRSAEALLAAGWTRRYLTDPDRAKEAVATYGALGFDVRAEPLGPSDLHEACAHCSASVCGSYVMIYTRERAAAEARGHVRILQPAGWRRPKGYANGVLARGSWLCVAGQVGWDENEVFRAHDLVGQSRQALQNIVAVLAQGSAKPSDVVRLTWYVTDKRAYLDAQADLGRVYREVMGGHFPAMSLVVVAGLVEDGALVEIEATAVLPEDTP
ncbi:MAG: RidA family protein [Planctomycetota bacterium]